MKKSVAFVVIFLAVAILVCLGLNGVSATDIGWCANLSSSDTYVLNTSVNSTGTCFNITAANVTLDCNGFTINFTSTAIVSNSSNTTIKNCNLYQVTASTGTAGIYFSAKNSNGTIFNNTISMKSQSGNCIYLLNSSGNNLTGNNLIGTGLYAVGIKIYYTNGTNNLISTNNILITNHDAYGIYLYSGASWNNITENNITTTSYATPGVFISSGNQNNINNNNITTTGSSDSYGIYLSSSTGNNLSSNKVITNGSTNFGFYSLTSTGNILLNNQFNTSSGAILITGSVSSDFNNTIGVDNLAEGLPIWYNYSVSNIMMYQNIDLSSSVGQLVCAWCSNVTYQNVTMGKDGISLFNASNSLINNSKSGSIIITSLSSSPQNNVINLLNITSSGIGAYLKG